MKIEYSVKIDISFNDKIVCSSTLFDYDETMNKISMFVKPGFHIPPDRQITLLFYGIGGNRSYCKGTTLNAYPGKVDVQLIGKITTESDRRRAIKISAEPSLKTIFTVEGKPYNTIIKDISETGVFVVYSDDLDVGHKCKLQILDLNTSEFPVKIVRRHADNSGYGCEFCNILQSDADKISSYICQRQMQDLNELRKKRKLSRNF